jgi:3-hydroxybutyryl-CoA dehydrogenase
MSIDLRGTPVLVVGAGIMGAGIVQVAALADHPVQLFDMREGAAAQAIDKLAGTLKTLVDKGKLAADAAQAAMSRITPIRSLAEARGAGLVVEAIVENLDAKRALFRELEGLLAPEAVLATNTSSISVTAIANGLQHPQRLVGMHFFNPVPLMALLELIRGLQTSDETHARAMEFARKVGKTAVTVRNSPGFAVNRILVPMINEAIFVLQEGLAAAEDIDAGMRLGCNHPIGPLALADMIGLDTLLAVMQVLYEGFNDPKYRPAPLLREMVDAGRLGRKSKHGFYSYA